MASEIQQLANLDGYLKISGAYPVCKLRLVLPERRPAIAQDILLRDFATKPMISIAPEPSRPDEQRQSAAQPVPVKPKEFTGEVERLKAEYMAEMGRQDGGDPAKLDAILAELDAVEAQMQALGR